jgi:hypothetical protein
MVIMTNQLAPTKKICKSCDEKKPLGDFRPSDFTQCRECWSKKYYDRKAEKEAREKQKENDMIVLRKDNSALVRLANKLADRDGLEQRIGTLEKQMRRLLKDRKEYRD